MTWSLFFTQLASVFMEPHSMPGSVNDSSSAQSFNAMPHALTRRPQSMSSLSNASRLTAPSGTC